MASKYQLRKAHAQGDAPTTARGRGEMDLGQTPAPATSPAVQQEIGSVSRRLEDLLVREAHLKLGREVLAPALLEHEAELKTIIEGRPTLLSFQSKEKRNAYEARLIEARETTQMLRDGVAQLDRVEPHIHRMIRDEIEDLLRASCPEYLEALAARQQKEDWRRCLDRFAQRVYEFLQALGNARNMACTGYTRDRQIFSQAAVQGFVIAIGCAEKVEAEVVFANRIAEMQMKLFRASGFDAKPLPKLPEASYSVWVSTLGARSLAEAQTQFDAMITQVRQLYETGVPEMLSQAQASDETNGSLIDNFLETAWQQLREEIAPRVVPAETEVNVAATERMLVEQAKSTVHGRLKLSDANVPSV